MHLKILDWFIWFMNINIFQFFSIISLFYFEKNVLAIGGSLTIVNSKNNWNFFERKKENTLNKYIKQDMRPIITNVIYLAK